MWIIYRRAVVFPLVALVFYILYMNFLRPSENMVLHSIPDISRTVSEDIYFKIEMKLKLIYENFDHRLDYLEFIFKNHYATFQHVLLNDIRQLGNGIIRKRSYKVKAELEKLYTVNKFKQKRLKSISDSILAKLERLQTQKCRLDNIVFVSLQQHNCGFGCHIHTLSVGLLISYYWEKTLVYSKIKVPGMEEYKDIFLPIANSCRLHDLENTTIIKEAFRPYKVAQQDCHDEKLFKLFYEETHELAKYHSDPVAFIIGHLMAYILRYDKESVFYKNLQQSKLNYNITEPYVGVHIRRSDKQTEALFYEIDDYMRYVDEFYGVYFQKYPEKNNTIQRTVYVASDEEGVFEKLKLKYPEYRFLYNNSFTKIAGSFTSRYSQYGFESILFDLYFLSQADHLVCTFTSNICRLAYELLMPRILDTYQLARSLDTHYFNHFGQELFRIAVLDNKVPEYWFKKGRLIKKKILIGPNFEGYRHDGFIIGELSGTTQGGVVPSYKTKDYY